MVTNGSQGPAPSSTPFLRFLLVTALLLPIVTALLLSWHSMGSLDVWLHNQVGQDILSGEGYPRTNTYSYTEPDHPWTNHEWLFQVAVNLLGPNRDQDISLGIGRWNLLRAILTAALMAVLIMGDGNANRFRRPGNSLAPRCWLVLPLMMGVMLLWPRLTLRPELVSFLFLVALIRVLDRPLAQWTPQGDWRDLVSPRRPLGQALLLTVAWSQFHGFSSLAPGVLLTALAASLLEKTLPGRPGPQGGFQGRWWMLALPLLLFGLCLTPNGIQGLLYPLRALGQFRSSEVDLKSSISELVPLLDTRDSLGYTLLTYQLSLIWGLIWIALTWGKTSLLRILIWAAAAFAAYQGQRNIGLYGVTFILLHTGTDGLPLWNKRPIVLRRLPVLVGGLLAVAAGLLVAIPWWGHILNDDFYLQEGVSRRFGSGANPGRYPVHTAEILDQFPHLRLFTNVDAAAFLLDRAEVQLYIDGRTEAYSSSIWADYADIKRGDEKALALLENSQPQGVFLSAGGGAFHTLTRTLLQQSDWRLTHYDETGFFFLSAPGAEGPRKSLVDDTAARTLGDKLPRRGSALSAVRAADLCLSWSLVMEVGGNQVLQEKALRRGLEFKPDHPQIQHNLGNILLSGGDFAAALPLFQGALRVNGRLAGSALNAGVCLLRLGQAEEARALFTRAAQINPQNFQAWANLSTACQALQDRESAIRALEKAARLQPGNRRISALLRQLRSRP